MIRPALVVLMLLPFAATASAECLKAQEQGTVEGRVNRITFSNPWVRGEAAWILELKAPACLTGPDKDYDDVESTKRIHIYATDAAVERQLKKALGKTVQVTGSPFGEENAHHHAPIVMGVDTITIR